MGIQVMFGQQALDTIFVNEHQIVALFFPSPIQKAVTGNERFVFSYDREETGHLGLLQGMDGEDSNLLVITTDGKVYAHIISYAASLPKMNYFINEGDTIGMERPERIMPGNDSLTKAPNPYKGLSKLLLDRAPKNLGTVRSGGIRLRLEELVYHGGEVYLLVGIGNRSDIDFEMKRLDILRVNGSKRQKASHQEIYLEPIYSSAKSTLIQSGKETRLVFVLPKFVLGKGESLKLVLEEVGGNRRVVLEK